MLIRKIVGAQVVLLLVFSSFLNLIEGSNRASILNNGGYHVRIGFDNNLEQSKIENPESLIAKIKQQLTVFSNHLYMATEGNFFINDVDIILPNSWNLNIDVDEADFESFENSDIRISDKFHVPQAQNPNLCGWPGDFIKLPVNFFQSPNEGQYGFQWKVLIALWARYRWGVWEEHGFIGNENYPYFYKERKTDSHWTPTGCSDSEIVGDFVNEHGEITDECDASKDSLPHNCRFHASSHKNDATSSLMSLHNLQSVTKFCDENTHDKNAPTRQNALCNYKSIWEVIRSTPDFKAVTEPSNSLKSPVFKVLAKKNSRPALYMLLDKGKTNFPSFPQRLNLGLLNMFSKIPGDTITTIGTFPSSGAFSVEESISWKSIAENKLAFENIIKEIHQNPEETRDFGLAIKGAVDAIKNRSPPGGAVLVVAKTGAGNNSFGDLSYEEEVLLHLRNEKIKLFVVELSEGVSNETINLVSFSKELDGVHHIVNTFNIDNRTIFETFGSNIAKALETPIMEAKSKTVNLFSGPVDLDTDYNVSIPPNITQVHYRLTFPATSDILFLGLGTNSRDEWDERKDQTKRRTISGTRNVTPEEMNGFILKFRASCRDCDDELKINLVVFANPNENPGTTPTKKVDIKVFTSANDNVLDFEQVDQLHESPFTIFAKINMEDVPISGLTVEALIEDLHGVGNWRIKLVDDGLGSPDSLFKDGIYSGSFVPSQNGLYKISVLAKNENLNPDSRIIPINQTEFDCSYWDGGCESLELNFLYQGYESLKGILEVRNRDTFAEVGRPLRITSLTVAQYGGNLHFKFPSPALVGLEQAASELTYQIYVAASKENLTSNPIEALVIYNRNSNLPPNSQEEIIIPLDEYTMVDDALYFAIITQNNNFVSSMSYIAMVEIDPTATGGSSIPTQPSTPSGGTGPTEDNGEISSPNTSSQPSSSTETPEEKKGFFKTAAGITVIVLIVVIALCLIAFGFWFYKKRSNSFSSSA